jgi:hypothetical protein
MAQRDDAELETISRERVFNFTRIALAFTSPLTRTDPMRKCHRCHDLRWPRAAAAVSLANPRNESNRGLPRGRNAANPVREWLRGDAEVRLG